MTPLEICVAVCGWCILMCSEGHPNEQRSFQEEQDQQQYTQHQKQYTAATAEIQHRVPYVIPYTAPQACHLQAGVQCHLPADLQRCEVEAVHVLVILQEPLQHLLRLQPSQENDTNLCSHRKTMEPISDIQHNLCTDSSLFS